jgi:serine/threonine protein phosphatase 1
MRTLCVGDIHGSYKGLMQVLERSSFDYKEDQLICLGDVADSWPDVVECFEELMKMDNLIFIRGNHDEWLLEWFRSNIAKGTWLSQGGKASLDSYMKLDNLANIANKHRKFIESSVYHYVDKQNRLYVHGGFNWHLPLDEWIASELMWDRHAFETASMWESHKVTHPTDKPGYFKQFNEVFVGHTATNNNRNWRLGRHDEPMHVANMWNLDQGAGWAGRLSIIDVDTKEFWQSDNSHLLYPEEAKIKGID